MERHQQMFQGLINPTHLFGEYLDVECLEQFVNTEKLRFEEEQAEEINFSISTTTPSLEDKIPFLQMLQNAESPTPRPFSPLTQGSTSFQTLLKFQHISRKKQQQQQQQPWESNYYYNNNNIINNMPAEIMESQIQPLELESCITHDMFETKLDMGNLQNPHSGASCLEGVSSECNREQTNSIDNGNNSGSSPACSVQLQPQLLMRTRQKAPAITRERRKRKRTTRASKNKEKVENQRMTHIAVERNRRRQMNDHLSSLRSLMPPSYVQRGDQASIIGGAIDFVKELEQLLQSLQAQKKMRKSDELSNNNNNPSSPSAGLNPLTPAQVTGTPTNDGYSTDGGRSGEHRAENRSEAADIEVTVIQTHVNLKIQCGRRPGQLLKVIVALEDLRLTVLHLNITSFESSVLYSFNLKIEDECKIGSADGIAGSVHQIFNYINGT